MVQLDRYNGRDEQIQRKRQIDIIVEMDDYNMVEMDIYNGRDGLIQWKRQIDTMVEMDKCNVKDG